MLSGRFHARMMNGLLAIFGSQLETTAIVKHSSVTRGREKRGQWEKQKVPQAKLAVIHTLANTPANVCDK